MTKTKHLTTNPLAPFAVLLCLLASLALSKPGLAASNQLDYRAYYEGMFSLGQEIPIADVSLELKPSALGNQELSLGVSSQAYDFVESRYPFRYLFRSLIDHKGQNTLAMDAHKQTNKFKREMYWLDHKAGQIVRLGSASAEPKKAIALPVNIQHWMTDEQLLPWHKLAFSKTTPVIDRLTLLQAIRTHDFASGKPLTLKVTTGKEIQDYTVKAEKETTLAGRSAWKLRIDGTSNKSGRPEPVHSPVYVWLEKGTGIPLRFEHNHPTGDFRIDLKELTNG